MLFHPERTPHCCNVVNTRTDGASSPGLKAGAFALALGNTQSNTESYYGSLLIGCRGRLFEVGGDYGVLEPLHGYSAVGSGSAFALGALHALRPQYGMIAAQPEPVVSPADQVVKALAAAGQFNPGVREPFHVLHMP